MQKWKCIQICNYKLYNSIYCIIDYYAEVFDKYRFEIRSTWKTIRNLIGTTNDKTTITQMFKVGNTQHMQIKFQNQINLMIVILK